jgi:hemerythrin-like domain-containing protein
MRVPAINQDPYRIALTVNHKKGNEGMKVTGEEHDNAHADTRVLQVVHKTFRLATTRMVDATERLEPSALKPVIGPVWNFYAAVLHHHHHTEDTAAFPALISVRPDMAALVDQLEEDHKKLAAAIDAVHSTIAAFDNKSDRATQRDLYDALSALRHQFFAHLDVEDAKIIPVLAEAIPPKDWDRMDNKALKSIPRQHLPKAVGALDEVIRSLPEAERPSAPPPPIRFMLAVSWRRKWSEFVKPLTA